MSVPFSIHRFCLFLAEGCFYISMCPKQKSKEVTPIYLPCRMGVMAYIANKIGVTPFSRDGEIQAGVGILF